MRLATFPADHSALFSGSVLKRCAARAMQCLCWSPGVCKCVCVSVLHAS